jgi:DNA-directed RNA polymerase subunit M/transcription elongation factor TFIIS
MMFRQCRECGGELVLARRSDEQGAGFNARPSNYWRCSICGGEFTAEQVRENKRSKQFEVAQRLDQRSVNRQGDDGSSSRMADEGCPNESPSVEDATGYSIEQEEVESMAEEAS